MFSVCLGTLSGFLFPELSQSPLSSCELLAAKASFVQQFTAYRLTVRRNTICFQIWLPLPGLFSGRNSEPSNPSYPLRISHRFVALLAHPPSVIPFPGRRAWNCSPGRRHSIPFGSFLLPFSQTFSSPLTLLRMGKREYVL